ncbi:unnamed protein product [Coccothraustes coccothraustes]
MRDPGMLEPGMREPGMLDPGMREQAGLASLPGPAHGAAVPALLCWQGEIRISGGQGIVLSSGFPWRFIKNEILFRAGVDRSNNQRVILLGFVPGGKKKKKSMDSRG